MPPFIKTNNDLMLICRDIKRRVSTQDEFNAELNRMGINRHASVVWSAPGRWGQQMCMGMIFGVDGTIVSF